MLLILLRFRMRCVVEALVLGKPAGPVRRLLGAAGRGAGCPCVLGIQPVLWQWPGRRGLRV